METRTLSRTGLNVSRMCCGTMTFGAQTDETTAIKMVDLCLDRGVTFFDTANVYNRGASETIPGKALKGRRDRVVLATKVAGKMGPAPDQSGLSRSAIARAVEDSLRRLQPDCLDICYLHWPDYAVPIEESLAAANRLVREGKVRQVGASKRDHLAENLRAADEGALPAASVAACDRVWERLRGPSPKYNR